MNSATFRTAPVEGGFDHLTHHSGPASEIRQVLAAHFVRDCPNILEIGGHIRPITSWLTHQPVSVTSVDPKTPPLTLSELNGAPCDVRHIDKKFQQVDYDYAPHSYGLVLLGYSLKPFGHRDPLGELLFSLIDNAKRTVIEYPPALDRAMSQVPDILARPSLRQVCQFEIKLDDDAIRDSGWATRRFHVLEPVN
jgi:hypothetical protein